MCSDKIARWCTLGVQGALLQQFLEEPLHINSLTVVCTAEPSKHSTEQALAALERAILGEPLQHTPKGGISSDFCFIAEDFIDLVRKHSHWGDCMFERDSSTKAFFED